MNCLGRYWLQLGAIALALSFCADEARGTFVMGNLEPSNVLQSELWQDVALLESGSTGAGQSVLDSSILPILTLDGTPSQADRPPREKRASEFVVGDCGSGMSTNGSVPVENCGGGVALFCSDCIVASVTVPSQVIRELRVSLPPSLKNRLFRPPRS